MNAERPNVRRILFGVFELDPSSGELYKHGIRIKLQDQPIQVLGLLLETPGEVVTRDELRQRIWDQDTFVDFDHSLNISINKLRDALGDSASSPRFIETLPRRGYRFIGSVRDPQPPPGTALSPAPQVSPVSVPATSQPAAGTAPPATPGASVDKSVIWKQWYVPVAVLLVFALAAAWFWQRNRDPLQRRRVMLAVLPFENLAPDQNKAYFVAGLHDELIAQLGRLHPSRLGVIARTSVIQYAIKRQPVDQIGRELHVDYVLDGAIRRVGDRFRITAELIQVSDQTHLWTETYEPNMSDMLGMQEDVARRVSQAIAIEFLPEAQQEFRQAAT
jgi:TolB-like protein/DNA-binding winged helix-turn-helix (wHTH) protein